MSVLLIGVNSDTLTYGFRRRKVRYPKWNQAHLKKQQQYRRDLDFQVQQKRLRRSRQKQIEKWTDINLEAMYNKELWRLKHQHYNYHQRHEEEHAQDYRQFQSLRNKNEENLSRSYDRGHHQNVKLPSIHNYSTTYLDSYGVTDQPNYHMPLVKSSDKSNEVPHRHDRVKTEVSTNYQRPKRFRTQSKANRYQAPQYQDPEVSLNMLRQYQDQKINEVYQMLADSVEILNSPANALPQWSSFQQKKPLHRKYRSSNQQKSNLNVDSKYYRLPSESRHIRLQDHKNSQQQREWRAWYARQKLQELHSYLKKEQIHDQIQEKILREDRPLYTLGFSPQT